MDTLYQKTGGFMKGICHPRRHLAVAKEAGFNWFRVDVSWFPWDMPASEVSLPERLARGREAGFRPVLITPYPSAFLRHGVDVTTPEGLRQAEDLCARLSAELAPFAPCWQASNEMHIGHFRAPLTHGQAVEFLAACIRGLRRGDPAAAVGHNSVDESWLDYAVQADKLAGGMDYVGLDLYAGTWTPGHVQTYLDMIDCVYERLRRPVVLMEFGFASEGGCMSADLSEAASLLNSWGFSSIEDATARIDDVAAKLPERLRRIAMSASPEERLEIIRPFFPHLLKRWPCPSLLPHTEEGQAAFYRELLPQLMAHPHLGGAVLYCIQDSPRCFLCGASDCPLETAWGLLRLDGSPKPAYHTVRDIFAKEVPHETQP